jgi:transposase-like protein
MLTLAGRLGRVTFGLSLLVAGPQAGWAENDGPEELATLAKADESAAQSKPENTVKKPHKAPPKLLEVIESTATPVASEETIESPSFAAESSSHRRRRAEEDAKHPSSRRWRGGMTAVTELPIERLRQRWNTDAQPQATFSSRSTLTEVMKRLAGWSDNCPLCGKPHSGAMNDLEEEAAPPKLSVAGHPTLGHVGEDQPSLTGDELSRPLRAGEPAQVILDTQRRLGKSVLEGTEFGGSPELLIQWIRALDEENRRQQAMLEEVSRADDEDAEEQPPAVTARSQLESLRNVCRQLQEAADALEDQNLFLPADEIRHVADNLRRKSRAIASARESDKPCSSLSHDAGESGE